MLGIAAVTLLVVLSTVNVIVSGTSNTDFILSVGHTASSAQTFTASQLASLSALTLRVPLSPTDNVDVDPPSSWQQGERSQQPFDSGANTPIGVPSDFGSPQSRTLATSWTHPVTQDLWLYGGESSGVWSDMWSFSRTANQWTFQGGNFSGNLGPVKGTRLTFSSDVTPGGISSACSAVDTVSGLVYIYGGTGAVKAQSFVSGTLFAFNLAKLQWAWIAGSDTAPSTTSPQSGANAGPGRRVAPFCWFDSGKFYVHGGSDGNGATNTNPIFYSDAWSYTVTSDTWTQLTLTGDVATPGREFGAIVVVPSSGSIAGTSTTIYQFGGVVAQDNKQGSRNYTNELFGITMLPDDQLKITRLSGVAPDPTNKDGCSNGSWGVKGTANLTNTPSGRSEGSFQYDAVKGRMVMYGGFGGVNARYVVELDDLWYYNLNSPVGWVWAGGSHTGSGSSPKYITPYGIIQPQSLARTSASLGSRNRQSSWVDPSGSVWIGMGSTGGNYFRNDLWRYPIVGSGKASITLTPVSQTATVSSMLLAKGLNTVFLYEENMPSNFTFAVNDTGVLRPFTLQLIPGAADWNLTVNAPGVFNNIMRNSFDSNFSFVLPSIDTNQQSVTISLIFTTRAGVTLTPQSLTPSFLAPPLGGVVTYNVTAMDAAGYVSFMQTITFTNPTVAPTPSSSTGIFSSSSSSTVESSSAPTSTSPSSSSSTAMSSSTGSSSTTVVSSTALSSTGSSGSSSGSSTTDSTGSSSSSGTDSSSAVNNSGSSSDTSSSSSSSSSSAVSSSAVIGPSSSTGSVSIASSLAISMSTSAFTLFVAILMVTCH